MKNKDKKFNDEGEQVLDFSNEFLVECPKCSLMAKIVLLNAEREFDIYSARKIICANCGFAKRWDRRNVIGYTIGNKISKDRKFFDIPGKPKKEMVTIGGNFDWFFQEPLWLQIECCGEELWAYNEKHLDFIENYVSAKLRERIPNKNRSLASRMPKWIKSAKNRDDILKAIKKLRGKLDAGH